MEKITITYPRVERYGYDSDEKVERMECQVTDLSKVSDGYHTIAELYDHRVTLFIALCRELKKQEIAEVCRVQHEIFPENCVWKSKAHGDGSVMDGWFIMGIGKEKGQQISYHIPFSRWNETEFAETLDHAPEWDGHTSADVLNRLKKNLC